MFVACIRPFLAATPASPVGIDPLQLRYREGDSLDPILRRTDATLDSFVREQYTDQIDVVLKRISAGWLESTRGLVSLKYALAFAFLGNSSLPSNTRNVRREKFLAIEELAFPADKKLGAEAFVHDCGIYLGAFTKILSAEFQVTGVVENSIRDSEVETQIRYEFIGTGTGFHREHRVGTLELTWQRADWKVKSWTWKGETRSRSFTPVFQDVTAEAFGANPSYAAQLVRGVDHWRTVLDGACGVDVYGHNGVSVGDIDGDGFDDVYLCQPGGLPNRLFRNRRDGTFEDITEGSGVGILDNTACAIFADFDNDGRQDLLVVRTAGPLLFLNEGSGKFRLKPHAFEFASPPQGTFTGAAVADYDRDGWLDIYFCLYTYYQGAGQYRYPTPYFDAENGPPNFLLRNQRDGTFRDVTKQAGLDRNNTRFSFCCCWGDYNRDGWPDLYVANDFGRKNLYRNNGDGTFTDIAKEAGVEDVGAGMSVCWLDYDNDGMDDLYVADMWTAAGERISAQPEFQKDSPKQVRDFYSKHAMGNSLFRNQGNGSFADATSRSGVGMGRWSWSSDAWDFDHDGYPDLYVANGMISGPVTQDLNSFFWRQVVANSPDTARASYEYEQGWNAINELIRADHTWSGYERNVFYANNRDGSFSDVSGAVGLDFLEDGRAFALADFDHDGRQEVFLKNRNAPQLRVLKNVVTELPPSVAFRLRGTRSNRDAIGASITIGRQTRTLQAGSGFLSQHSKELFFGLGDSEGALSARVKWPSGLTEQLNDVPPNHIIHVEEGMGVTRTEPFRKLSATRPSFLAKPSDSTPLTVETWLLVPIPAPLAEKPRSLVTVDARTPEDTVAVYNLLFRSIFDRHRDLTLPTSFLLDEDGNVVKIYQGATNPEKVQNDLRNIPRTAAEKLAKALPFPGNSSTYEFGRNYLSLGSTFFQRGYLEQADQYFRSAVRDDPASAEAHYGIGSVYLKQNHLREARTSFEEALKRNAGYPETRLNAWNNLGLLATRQGKLDTAIDYFQQALQASPDYFIALQNLGSAYRQSRQWEAARATLERAVALRPNDAEANYSLGMVFAQTDDSARAQDYLQRALKINPAYPEALNNLGILYLRTRRRNEAVAQFEECIRVAPAFDQSYLNLARVFEVEGVREKARSVLRELLKQHPDHSAALRALEQIR